MPSISIFLFCKNRVKTIRRSVESVLNQDFQDFEYIVQDGASTDGTLELLKEYGDRIDLVSEDDSGPADAFWRALKRCNGDYIGSCLSDEEIVPDAIRVAFNSFQEYPDTGAITRDAYLTDFDGVTIGNAMGSDFDLIDYLSCKSCPHFSATFFKRETLGKIGLGGRIWNQDCGEFELWCRLALNSPIHYVPGFASKYALHKDQLSNTSTNIDKIIESRIALINQLFKDEPYLVDQLDKKQGCIVGTLENFSNHLRHVGALDKAEYYRSSAEKLKNSGTYDHGCLRTVRDVGGVVPGTAH